MKLTGFHLGLARISPVRATLTVAGHIRPGLRLSVLRRSTAKTFSQQTLPGLLFNLLFSSHDYATVMTEVNAQSQNILVCLLTCSAVEG